MPAEREAGGYSLWLEPSASITQRQQHAALRSAHGRMAAHGGMLGSWLVLASRDGRAEAVGRGAYGLMFKNGTVHAGIEAKKN